MFLSVPFGDLLTDQACKFFPKKGKCIMKYSRFCLIILFFFSAILTRLEAGNFSTDLMLGYSGGFGVQVNGMVSGFAKGFPMNLSVGIGYTGMDPGNAADARRIFINDATNGDPEKSGHRWDFRMDFLYQVNWLSLQRGFLYGGVRYTSFNGNFKFIGGNEDFNISSDNWGIGVGGKAYFDMGGQLDFVVTAGADYFFASDLSGHDTVYSPDGENINPRRDYTYDTADDAIGQPKLEPILMIGLNYRFR